MSGTIFKANDTVLILNSPTFYAGPLYFDASDSGLLRNPVVVRGESMDGVVIDHNGSGAGGVLLYNVSNMVIENLTLTHTDTSYMKYAGIYVYDDDLAVQLENLRYETVLCEISWVA